MTAELDDKMMFIVRRMSNTVHGTARTINFVFSDFHAFSYSYQLFEGCHSQVTYYGPDNTEQFMKDTTLEERSWMDSESYFRCAVEIFLGGQVRSVQIDPVDMYYTEVDKFIIAVSRKQKSIQGLMAKLLVQTFVDEKNKREQSNKKQTNTN